MINEILITQEEQSRIKKRLRKLIDVDRKKVIEEIKKARKLGDLSENADYDTAKKYQSEIEFQINTLTNKLKKSKIITKSEQHKKIGIGTTFKFLNLNSNKIDSVYIGGSFESNPFTTPKIISYESPFAKSIINKEKTVKKGDIIMIITKTKNYKIKILDIKH